MPQIDVTIKIGEDDWKFDGLQIPCSENDVLKQERSECLNRSSVIAVHTFGILAAVYSGNQLFRASGTLSL